MDFLIQWRHAVSALALASLVACGGGGGGSATSGVGTGTGTVANPGSSSGAADVSTAQGFWSGPVDAQTSASVIVLPDGSTWVVLQSATTLNNLARGTATLSNANAFSVSGRSYNLATGVVSSAGLSGILVPKASLSVAATSNSPAYTLTYNKAYETPAKLADVAGRWSATRGAGAVQLSLDISASGALTGSSSTACTYAGTLTPHANAIAVFNLSLTETCLGTPAQTYSGIATTNTATNGLSMAFTTADQATGSAIQATRVPVP